MYCTTKKHTFQLFDRANRKRKRNVQTKQSIQPRIFRELSSDIHDVAKLQTEGLLF